MMLAASLPAQFARADDITTMLAIVEKTHPESAYHNILRAVAGEQGNGDAALALSESLGEEKHLNEDAYHWLNVAADHGKLSAQMQQLRSAAWQKSDNLYETVETATDASDMGKASASYQLAQFYGGTYGGVPNTRRAQHYCALAASQGDARASICIQHIRALQP